jgi:hypothetical protein
MGRYPSKNGIALPVIELGYDVVPFERRKTTNHHRQFDRAWYMEKRYRQVFRGLLPHLDTMPIDQHIDLHDRYSAPIMPPDSLQIAVVDEYLFMHGQIDVVRESKTNETYQITADQWARIRDAR